MMTVEPIFVDSRTPQCIPNIKKLERAKVYFNFAILTDVMALAGNHKNQRNPLQFHSFSNFFIERY